MNYLNNHYLLLIICKYLTTITTFKVLTDSVPESPCPNVFEYRFDNANNMYGFIEAPSPVSYNNIILLEVQLSIGNTVQGFNGNIALVSPRPRIIEDLLQKKPIDYKLEFPYWIKVPPRITKILVNGNQICFGYPIDRNIVPVLTTINLQHTLTISVPLNTGSKVNNVAPLPNLSFVDDVVTRETTYPFIIPDSKSANPTINFNPQLPKDPSKIYAANPFLNSNNNFRLGANIFYQNQNPSGQAGYNFLPNDFVEALKPAGQASYDYLPNHFVKALKPVYQNYPQYIPSYQPNYENNPIFSNSGQNAEYPLTPAKLGPGDTSQHGDVTPRPQNDVTAAPVRPSIESNFFPTQSPKEAEVEDLPTAESNFVKKPFSGVCGISVNTNALLINGNRVAKGVHPWLAALFKQNDEGLKFRCGSTLISQKHVVTAAHCVRSRRKKTKPEELWIVLGRENIQRWSNDGAQIVQAESTHVHPDYQFSTADADIAVIVLSEEAVFSNLIKPICLWTGDKNQKLIVEKKGTVVGWGKDETGKVSTSEPRKLTFPVVSEEDCLRSNSGFREITSNRTFCAGYRNNSGPCNGDSGSGFLTQKGERWTLRGIVSMSLLGPDGGCDLKQYIVFTDAAQFTDWLLSFLD